MAFDVERLKLVNGFLFPKDDIECCGAVFNELHKIDKIPVTGRRVAIQAGGNCGVFPVYLAKRFAQVITFEPDPINYECMYENLDRFIGPDEHVTAINAGLADELGDCRMFEPEDEPNNCGALQVVKGGEIPLMTIDSLKLEGVDLIYLDIEGYEDLALLGAVETIARDKPTIVCENKGLNDRFPETPPNPSEEFRDWLCAEFGYVFAGRLMRDDIFVCSK